MNPPTPPRITASRRGILRLALLGILPALGAEPSASDAVLKEKGLKRSGQALILPEEAEVQAKVKEAGVLYKQLSFAIRQQQAFTQGAADGKAMIQQLTQQRIMLNQQLSQVTTAADNNRLIGMINSVGDQINLLSEAANDHDAAAMVAAQVPRQREAYVQAVIDLRQLVDAATARYEELAKDEDVKKALEALNLASKSKVALGPSRAFLANVALLNKVEASVLSESIELRREGGVYWVDVTFNGKVTKPMIFDTGASSVVLPYELARELGLKPGPNDPTVRTQVADGSIVVARQMTIPSLRVGKFTIKDVVGIVMPSDKQDVPPLLGGTFQKFFSIKFSPDSGKLVLSKVETPDEPAATPKAKTSRTTKTKR